MAVSSRQKQPAACKAAQRTQRARRLGIRGRAGRRLQWQPQHKKSVKSFLGKTLKFVVTGSVFYLGVAFVTGGRDKVQADMGVLRVRPCPGFHTSEACRC